MKKIIHILILLFCLPMVAQQFEIDSTKIERIRVEGGLFVPLGNLCNKMGVSKEIGVYYRLKMPHNDMADLGFKFYFPENNQDFTYYGRDSTYLTQSKSFGIMALMKINKEYSFHVFTKEVTFEYTSGFGINFFLFDNKEMKNTGTETYTDENGNLVYKINTDLKALMSPLVSQGFGFSRKKIGLHFQYNFTPYNWFSKRIEKSFGNSSFSLGINYRI